MMESQSNNNKWTVTRSRFDALIPITECRLNDKTSALGRGKKQSLKNNFRAKMDDEVERNLK